MRATPGRLAADRALPASTLKGSQASTPTRPLACLQAFKVGQPRQPPVVIVQGVDQKSYWVSRTGWQLPCLVVRL